MTLTDFGTMILAFATTISLIYISRQVNSSRQQAKGQFLLALADQFERHSEVSVRLVNEPDFKPTGSEWLEIWKLMAIFERMNIMVEDRILDVGIVDRLYGFILLIIVSNDEIYHRLKASGAEWQDFIDLCYAVADHREKNPVSEQDKAFIERVRKLDKSTRRLQNPWRLS